MPAVPTDNPRTGGWKSAVREGHRSPGEREGASPKHAQEVYKSAFNSAEKQYGDESTAHKVAWSAVENKYKKDEDSGDWVRKDS